ncbi:insulin-like growth factor-binding protein-related protein 1 [Littorina saxatilis]|uniref:Insulin-like growth factor-binding protein-related protein 1 n=1 Tax=Littorina saxatilis TaxID=31220 RepID=A0AAN9BPF2_9CAEN
MKLECALGVMAAVLAVAMAAKKCPVCDPEACPALNGANCLAGTTKDDCGCCDICARLEGRPCNIDANDQCGDGLECRESESTGAICLCKFQEILCGSDNKTYSNLCQLMATAVREQRTNTLNVKSVGPCEPGATIVTKPEYVRNHTDSNVVLQCEAMGLPTPSMAWVFTRADNQTFNLPGDDCKLVTSSRGGPGKFMVTSWLQIEGLQKFHEGDYTCVAFNQHHTDRSKARIKVVEQ